MQLAKRLLMTVILCFGVVFLLVVFTARIPAGPPVSMASGNGDLNGDGEIDVSDAVHR